MGQKKIANANYDCIERLKMSYIEAIFELCQSKQAVFRHQKYIEELEGRKSGEQVVKFAIHNLVKNGELREIKGKKMLMREK